MRKFFFGANRHPFKLHQMHRNISASKTQMENQESAGFGTSSKRNSPTHRLMDYYPFFADEIVGVVKELEIIELTKRTGELVHYNLPTGKKHRGITVMKTYEMLEQKEFLNSETIRLAAILGWCMELLEVSLLILDDIMDRSDFRRNFPCWYKTKSTGLSGINDGFLLYTAIYRLLKKHFSNHHCFIPICELFHEGTLKTAMGQAVDTLSAPNGIPNLDFFTLDKYTVMSIHKGAYFSVYLPIALGMYLANWQDPKLHKQTESISCAMGYFLQVENDYSDCFAKPYHEGNDINNGKLTWLVVEALQRGNSDQRALLEKYYGHSGRKPYQIIRNLYEELTLPSIYASYKLENAKTIRGLIQQVPVALQQELLFQVMETFYGTLA